ncbi:MAG: TatD family hydrolase [Armatimonadota bacterium]
MIHLTDTHCHLNDPAFLGREAEVIARAATAGVASIIVPAWDEASAVRALELAESFPAVYPAAGLHPWFVTEDADIGWLPAMLDHPRVIAVGEIGLDWGTGPAPSVQEKILRTQLAFAKERDLPVLFHCRRGWDRLIACVREYRVRGVLHAFSGSLEVMEECLKLGLYIAFAGMVTRPLSHRAHEAARHVPLDHLLLETDAPSMALDGIPAEETEPAHVTHVLAAVAKLRGEDAEAVARQVGENVRELFGIK